MVRIAAAVDNADQAVSALGVGATPVAGTCTVILVRVSCRGRG